MKETQIKRNSVAEGNGKRVCVREIKAYVLVLLYVGHQSICILIHLSPSIIGNCLYVAGDYARAKEIFLEAGPRSA